MADQLPYPMMFDPTQLSNQFSNFQKKKLTPYMGLMAGNAPTNALGAPIQGYADTQAKHDAWAAANPAPASTGMTLNSSPMGQAQWMQGVPASAGDINDPNGAYNRLLGPEAMILHQNPQGDMIRNSLTGGQASWGGTMPTAASLAASQQAPAAAAAASANPYDMSQAYLTALSNPGKVTTPGATVPQAPTPTGQSGVLDQFLANWKAKGSPTTGAGNYNNAGFFAGLQGTV